MHPPRIHSITPTFSENVYSDITYTRLPAFEEFVFEWRFMDDKLIYRGEAGDFIKFFAYSGPSSGFGGREFQLRTVDNRIHTLEGPWSSREGIIHEVFPDRPRIIATTNGFVSEAAVIRLGHTVREVLKFDGEEIYAYVSA